MVTDQVFVSNVKITLLQVIILDVKCFMTAELSLSLSHINLANYLNINLIWQKHLCIEGEVAGTDTEGGFAAMY